MTEYNDAEDLRLSQELAAICAEYLEFSKTCGCNDYLARIKEATDKCNKYSRGKHGIE